MVGGSSHISHQNFPQPPFLALCSLCFLCLLLPSCGSESPPPPASNIDNNATRQCWLRRGCWPLATMLTTPTQGEEDRITISYHPPRSRAARAGGLQLDIGIHWVLAGHGVEPAQVSPINGNVHDTENGNNVFAGHHCPVSCCIEVPTEMVTAAAY